MSKSIEAKKTTIGTILGKYERRSITIPQYQRSFSWEKGQIATFWNDLLSFKEEFLKNPITASYFLGPIVLLDQDSEIKLLDGQQRLATAIILLSTIRDLLRLMEEPNGGHACTDYARDIQRDLIQKNEDPIEYSLILNDLDEPFFLNTIKKDSPKPSSVTVRSHKLLQNAKNFFTDELDILISGKAVADA